MYIGNYKKYIKLFELFNEFIKIERYNSNRKKKLSFYIIIEMEMYISISN